MPKFARITGVITLILPTAGIPLGLGDIELHSALNQPLNADIGLLDVSPASLGNIQVNFANGDEFQKLGLDRPSFLSSIKMELRKDESGRQFINLSSSQAIREPFIDVLLAVSWPQGRLVKEYTMLLDPPVFLDAPAAPVSAPATAPVAQAGGTTAEAATAQVDATPATASAPATTPEATVSNHGFSRNADGSLSYGPVQRSDTLWSIAQTLKTEDRSTVPQVMMALLRDNPEAFYHQNVNDLKAGYVLRIRHPEAISAMSQAAAEAEVRAQYAAWRAAKEGRPVKVNVETATKAPSGVAQGASEAPKIGPHLELVSAESGAEGTAAGAAGEGVTGAADSTTRVDLLAAIEASDVAQQENKALRDRLAMLEKQMADMRRLLVLKGDTLTALQDKGTAVVVPNPDVDAADQPAQSSDQLETNGDATTVVAVVEKSDKKPAPVVAPEPAPEPSFLGQILGGNLWYMIFGGGVILLLLALFAKRRQGMKEAIDLASGYSDDDEAVVQVSVPAATSEETTEASVEESVQDEAEMAAETLLNDVQSGQYASPGIDDEDIDTLSEADVYLAYRRFDKAEQLLKDALQQEPDRHDLQLKLLEVYAKSEKKEAFVLRAEALQVLLNDDESEIWRKVVRLGQPFLGDHPLFGGSEVAADAVAETETDPLPEAQIGAEIVDDSTGDEPLALAGEPEEAFFDEPVEVEAFAGEEVSEETPDTSGADETRLATDPDVSTEVSEAGMADMQESADHRDIPLEFEISSLEQRLDAMQEDETDANAVPDETGVEFTTAELDTADDEAVPDAVAEQDEAAVEPEDTTVNAVADVAKDAAESDDDMAWLDEVVDSDLDDLIGGGENMMTLDEDIDLAGPISGEDNFATNLDLARAYIDMGDMEAARAILEGLDDSLTDVQRAEIHELMKKIA